MPILLLYGERDERSPLNVARALHAAIPTSTLVVLPGLGHVCCLESPDAFGQQVRAVDVRAVDQRAGRDAGVLLAAAGSADPIEATVALLAEAGDRVLTSDPADLTLLLQAANRRALVVAC